LVIPFIRFVQTGGVFVQTGGMFVQIGGMFVHQTGGVFVQTGGKGGGLVDWAHTCDGTWESTNPNE
jgi:hypothetical protein